MREAIIVLAALAVFSAGCLGPEPIGGDKDEHGCLIAAGYSWCEAKQKCLRTWEEPCEASGAEITDFASCAAAGNPVMESYPRQCAHGGQTYVEESCSSDGNILTLADAIEIAKASECGDRLNVECICPDGYVKNGKSCDPSCYESDPPCLAPSIRCESTYVCNENTGTYWIDLDIEKAGCMPACVVNLEDRTAEINWRCTGLIPE